MKALVVTDIHVYRKEGKFYIAEQVFHIIKRYSEKFGKIDLYARTAKELPPSNVVDASEYIDSFFGCKGIASAFKKENRRTLKDFILKADLVVVRLHSVFGYLAGIEAKRQKKPYFAEVMGDAWDAYWNHGFLGKLIAPFMYFGIKQVVWHADFALYVTNEYLQKRYPCKNAIVGVSNVLIKSVDNLVLEKRLETIATRSLNEISLMTAAAVDVRFKGQEYVIRAIPAINKAGYKVKYYLAGGGSQDYLRSVAKKCGVLDQVVFLGRLSLDEVMQTLDEIDIYIQPSLQEGLPRSVIEAMSRACPVVGARTAGIPELISPECVVKRKSSKDIAKTVLSVFSKDKLIELSKINFEKSKEYLDSVLMERRNAYYDGIKGTVEK